MWSNVPSVFHVRTRTDSMGQGEITYQKLFFTISGVVSSMTIVMDGGKKKK